jgi:hypothetical protein
MRSNLRRGFLVRALLLLLSHSSLAQPQPVDSLEKRWSYSASGYYYFVPDDKNTITIIGTADHRKLHLEARYNYEDRNTGSVFAGYRLEAGNKLQFEIVPIAGVAFGNTNGLVPGLEFTMTYKKFDFYSETEYVLDFAGKENNFFYVWGEIGITPIAALRTGLVYQRTHLYQIDFDV